jgi:hypothetical protein
MTLDERDETNERFDRQVNVTRRFSRSGSRAHSSDETREKGASRASVARRAPQGRPGKKKKTPK